MANDALCCFSAASVAAAAAADFLEKTIGHFYCQPEEQSPAQGQQQQQLRPKEQTLLQQKQAAGWVPKSKAAFIQIPQDFFNVDATDPMVSFGVMLHAHCLLSGLIDN